MVMGYNVNEYRAIVIVTADRKAIPETVQTVLEAIFINRFKRASVFNSASGLFRARTIALKQLYDIFKVDKMRGFLIDSDIFLYETSETLAKYMKKADEEN
jgi:hypothetical protein